MQDHIENQFRPLFALTPGVNQIQFDMDISMLQDILFLSAQSAVICLQSVAPCQLPSLVAGSAI